MITFLDGPAVGQHLMLKRGPYFLRVVVDGTKWDALDQLSDTPSPSETIYAYRMEGKPGMCHIRSGKKGASGFYVIAEYRYVEAQPTDAEMRDSDRWSKWCHANKPADL